MPPLTEDDNGGERDKRGRFRKGSRGGPGGARHEYIRERGRLYEALRQELSIEKLTILCRGLLIRALKGDTRAAALLLFYRLGKPPEAMTPRELFPLARVPRAPAMSIEAIAESLQRTYEDYQSGRLNEAEARMSRDILSSLLEARQAGELDAKVSELLTILKERTDDAQSS